MSKQLIFCTGKNVDKHGVTKSFYLKDSAGNTGEFTRQQVLNMFSNPGIEFVNLKLSSDNKILFSSSYENFMKGQSNKSVDPAKMHSLLLSNLQGEDGKEYLDGIVQSMNECTNNKERQTVLRDYISDFYSDIDEQADYALNLLNRLGTESKSLVVTGRFRDGMSVVGYRFRNIGNKPINFIESEYYEDEKGIHLENTVNKSLDPGKEVDLNRIDAIRLVAREEFGGTVANGKILVSRLKEKFYTPEDFLRCYYIETSNTNDVLNIDGSSMTNMHIKNSKLDKICSKKRIGLGGLFSILIEQYILSDNNIVFNIMKDAINECTSDDQKKQVIKGYIDIIKDGLKKESYYNNVISKDDNYSKGLVLRSKYYINGKEVGYEIENISDKVIPIEIGSYEVQNGSIILMNTSRKLVSPRNKIVLNRIDAVKLLSTKLYRGVISNGRIALVDSIDKPIHTVDDLLNVFSIGAVHEEFNKLDGNGNGYLNFEYRGEKKDKLANAKGIKGYMDAFKR